MTLSHAQLQRLGRCFLQSANLWLDQDRRINEWLGEQIAAAKEAESREKTVAEA